MDSTETLLQNYVKGNKGPFTNYVTQLGWVSGQQKRNDSILWWVISKIMANMLPWIGGWSQIGEKHIT